MDEQIKKYNTRFGNRIPDNILRLFFEDELYAYVLNHKIGRELTCDIFFHICDLIKKIVTLAEKEALIQEKLNLGFSKAILQDICTCVKECKDSNDELSIRDSFNKEEWTMFYNSCKTVERYDKEKKLFDNGRQFYAAYKTIMAKGVEEHIEGVITSGYESIWSSKIALESLYEIQLYKSVKMLWHKRLVDYGKNLIRIRKMIYKES